MGQLLWIVFVVIVAIWMFGIILDVAGDAIHLLLVIALIVLLYNIFIGRRRV